MALTARTLVVAGALALVIGVAGGALSGMILFQAPGGGSGSAGSFVTSIWSSLFRSAGGGPATDSAAAPATTIAPSQAKDAGASAPAQPPVSASEAQAKPKDAATTAQAKPQNAPAAAPAKPQGVATSVTTQAQAASNAAQQPGATAGVASSKPQVVVVPRTLRPGVSSAAVVTLGYLLRHHGATIEPDSEYDQQTEAAVRAFQQARGQTVDGIVGPQTWATLFVTVRQGDRSPAVAAVQHRLGYDGLYSGVADGRFSPDVEAAVRVYQQQQGLPVDGVVGESTWMTLVEDR